MMDRSKNGQETIKLSGDDSSTQTRGLSQRLRKPVDNSNGTHHITDDTLPAYQKPDDAMISGENIAVEPGNLNQQAVRQQEAHMDGLLVSGVQLQNRYKILGVIGIGGMGAVYKAQDLRFPGVMRICAVKEMINTATDPEVRQMIVRNFEREASILATLSFPAIPQIYDYFTQGSRSYLVIEYVSGKDLEAFIAEKEGFFSEREVISWAVQLCDVLTFLHNHKPRPIIFRDLKPSNIMLDEHNRIRLVDFGIAKLFQSGDKGTMIGTEGYSPPEQYRGIAEPRGDVYALGATLHHLLSKQDPRLEPPFSFRDRSIHKTNPVVSRQLVNIIDKALDYDVNKRWGSAEEFKRALLSISSSSFSSSNSQSGTRSFTSGIQKPIWRFACEDEVRGTVAVSEDMVYVPSYDHNIYALDIDDGRFIWKFPAKGGIASTPAVSGGKVVFGSADGNVYAINKLTGEAEWKVKTNGKVFSSPTVELEHVFIGSDDMQLYAIHLQTGKIAWKYNADGEVRSKPAVSGDHVYFACQLGMVYAIGYNREFRWRYRTRRDVLASPIIYKDLLFIGSMDWNFYA
ncbi:MAG: serine/threonine-protein kinase, partial [Anaerolineae bacterium]|nr:serine/threonine-protein kinase [Anaerolineae bacterium]